MTLSIKEYGLKLLLLLLLGTLFGCAAPKPTNPRIVDTIILKNSTGEYIHQVAISKDFSNPAAKVGSISPLPINAQQIFERPSNAKKLPNTLQIHWVTVANKLHKKEISIKDLLLSVSEKEHLILVFDFHMHGVINVYIQN